MQDNMKHNNIHIIGIPEGEEEEQGIENLFEKVMMENFPDLLREKSPKSRKHRESQARRTQRGPLQDTSKINGKSPRQREDLKGSKGETGSNIQGSSNKVSN